MAAARIAAPLWRSSGRCLALRPKAAPMPTAGLMARTAATAATAATAGARSVALAPARHARRGAARHAVAAATQRRGYADDAAARGGGGGGGEQQQEVAGEKAGEAEEAEAASVLSSAQSEAAAAAAPGNEKALRQLERLAQGLAPFDAAADGHKFGLTTATTRAAVLGGSGGDGDDTAAALPQARKLQERYDPVTAQLTRLLMRDGKLAKAQRDMALILNYLRTSAPPKLNPARPLLPGHPPAAQLPLDPVRYLALAVDSVGPLVKIKSLSGQAGGGRALPVPLPLAARQRRRTAFVWLLEVVNKRAARGSGRGMLAQRVAEEVVAVVEGRSSLWDKRQQLHKQATSARINVNALRKSRRR